MSERNNIQVFCDFDGTITTEDTLGKFFPKFATPDWVEWENRWLREEIGSRECLDGQIKCVPNLAEGEFNEFIKSIEIDKYFKEFIEYLEENEIDFYIVSDGFDLFIRSILENNGLGHIKFFSNTLTKTTGGFVMDFPNTSQSCKRGSGTCKCNVINRLIDPQKKLIYIGDGISDFCAARNADIVFAKRDLLRHCQKNNLQNYIEFQSFEDVIKNVKNRLQVNG